MMAIWERAAYENTLSHAVDSPNGRRFEHTAEQQQPPADAILVLVVLASGFDLCFGDAILGLGNADDHHDLVVRPDDISVDALRLGVDGPATLIVELVVTARVLDALPLNHIVIWRPALQAISLLQECRTRCSSQPYQSLGCQRSQPPHGSFGFCNLNN